MAVLKELLPILYLFITSTVYVHGEQVKLPMYTQELTIDKYIYKSGLPAISAFTMCYWYKGLNSDRLSDHPISISSSVRDNEFITGWSPNDRHFAHFNGASSYYLEVCDNTELNNIMLVWNKHCYTWSSGGIFKWYVTFNSPDLLEVYRSVSTGSHSFPADSNLVLFQEQDCQVGCFSVGQTTEVMAAWFNMWDYELTSDQVNALTCYDEGNVVTLTDMSLGGAAHFTYSQSFECDVKKADLEKVYTKRQHSMTMCKVTGAKLSNFVISTTTSTTAANCVLKCSKNPACKSANYDLDSGNCELNEKEGGDYTTLDDYSESVDANNLYFSSKEC